MGYKLILILVLTILSSCANSKKDKPWYLARTYSEIKLNNDQYLFFLEGEESKEFLKDFLLLRISEMGLESNNYYFSIDAEEAGNDKIISKGFFWRLSAFEVKSNSPNVVSRIVTYYKDRPTKRKFYEANKEVERIKSLYGKWYFDNVSQYQINAMLNTRPKELLYSEQAERQRLFKIVRKR